MSKRLLMQSECSSNWKKRNSFDISHGIEKEEWKPSCKVNIDLHIFKTIYSFFQTLYSLLPALLDNNPFRSKTLENSITKTEPLIPNMDDILSVFQKALDMFTECHLHPQITSQLFCYLFYFTSTTVFNSMMTKGTYKDTIFFFIHLKRDIDLPGK